ETPNGLYVMPICPAWFAGVGIGTSPPARKLAGRPVDAVKFGSARMVSIPLRCSAPTRASTCLPPPPNSMPPDDPMPQFWTSARDTSAKRSRILICCEPKIVVSLIGGWSRGEKVSAAVQEVTRKRPRWLAGHRGFEPRCVEIRARLEARDLESGHDANPSI